jgi:hypothetical protein
MMSFSRVTAAVLAVAATLTACSGGDTKEGEPSPPDVRPTGVDAVLQYTNRWIENPSLDLMSPQGTFVRAAMESLDRVRFGEGRGADALKDGGYPGFVKAFNNVIDPDVVAGNARKDQTEVGTLYWEVVRFQPDGDGFSAGVCSYGSMADTKVWNGYRSSGRSLPAGNATWITFGPNPDVPDQQQISPRPMQRGPRNGPNDNVFGTWVLTNIKISGANADLPQCGNTLAPGTPADAPEDYYVNSDPPPTLPPSPGWPDKASS